MKYTPTFLMLVMPHTAGVLFGFGIGSHDTFAGVLGAIASIAIFTFIPTTKDKAP